MKIIFIGNFARGYVGEIADEVQICNEIEFAGHTVYRVPRDEWREHVIQNKPYVNVPEGIKADIAIIAKWPHFYDGSFIEKVKEKYKCPCLYFVWDYMGPNPPDWHIKMIRAADKYLGNDVFDRTIYPPELVPSQKLYYFPFDVASAEFDRVELPKEYDVVFFGSHFGAGDRVEWLKKLNKNIPIKIFSWNADKWREDGFDASDAVYGEDFVNAVAKSKIILQFSVNDHCWGYWSNRIGKVLTLGGFLLVRYAPGMELFLKDGVDYFSTMEEMTAKVIYYLDNPTMASRIADRGYEYGRRHFTSKARIGQLLIFIDRYLRGAF